MTSEVLATGVEYMTMVESNVEQDCWTRVKGRLRTSVGEDVYQSWFTRMDLESIQDENVHLSVPTRFLKSWIQTHYAERVLTCWRAEKPNVHRVDLTVRTIVRCSAAVPVEKVTVQSPKTSHESTLPAQSLRTAATAPVSISHDAIGGSPLDPRFTFGSFVIGRTNQLAHAAAKQVAEGKRDDLVMFNPLYIHADVGLGKTHLLQAIAWAGNDGSSRKVLYLTAEKFMYGFIAALKTQTALAFKETLRGIDVLVVDDFQFLRGKSSQAEFCHTLNALLDSGKQVVVGSNQPPSELEELDERIRSRLVGGLVVEMGRLAEESRLEILKLRVATAKKLHPVFEVSEDVLAYLAQVLMHNGRDLDGAFNRLLARSLLKPETPTLQAVEGMIHDLIRPPEAKRVKIEDIQRVVARHYNVSRNDLISSRRTQNVVRPRQVAMYLAKIFTLRSLPEIGRRFGGRDHTTVLHAVNKIGWAIGERSDKVPSSITNPHVEVDQQLKVEVESLKKQLQE